MATKIKSEPIYDTVAETHPDLMPTGRKFTAKEEKRLAKGRAHARECIISRGMVSFRADPDMMDQLLTVAHHKRIPYGVLARTWVMDCLRKEVASMNKKSKVA